MGRHHRRVKRVPTEEIGLDIKSLNEEVLEELAGSANDAVRNELKEVLPLRDDYVITSSVELRENSLIVTFDVMLRSSEPVTPEVASLIEEAIDKGLRVIEDELTRKYVKVRD